MKRKYHCVVPGCTKYDVLSYFIQMPENSTLRDVWLSNIPRKDWLIDNTTVICTKHFKQTDFKVSTPVVRKVNGKEFITKCLIPINGNATVPSIFPKPTNIGPIDKDHINNFYPDFMFQSHPRDSRGPDIFKDLEKEGSEDFIIDYWYLKITLAIRLKRYLDDNWNVKVYQDYIAFYVISLDEVPRIIVSIKIDTELKVIVTLANRFVDPVDLNWILPVTCKLNRWTQLEAMLRLYGK